MRRELLDILADPASGASLALEDERVEGDAIVDGRLTAPSGASYPIRDGIPRFVVDEDAGQQQTAESFGYKWRREETYDTPEMYAMGRRWWAERHGLADISQLTDAFRSKRRILDAGCGSGLGTSFWMAEPWDGPQWIGLDISEAIDVAKQRLGGFAGTHFVQGDVLRPPFAPGTFDAVISEGVLHHTPSTEAALAAVASTLEPGGEIRFYVYRRKGPVREFADDHIRDVVAAHSPEDAWEALRPLTKLGQALAELGVEVDVPEDIPYLGITAGRHDVQRLLYWNFVKLYWNPDFSFDVNHHVNFDWYHPRYAHRHTAEEIERWCEELGLRIDYLGEQESGFTVRATRV